MKLHLFDFGKAPFFTSFQHFVGDSRRQRNGDNDQCQCADSGAYAQANFRGNHRGQCLIGQDAKDRGVVIFKRI